MEKTRIFVVYVSTDTGHLYHQEFDDEQEAQSFLDSADRETDRALIFKITNKCDAYPTVVDIEDRT